MTNTKSLGFIFSGSSREYFSGDIYYEEDKMEMIFKHATENSCHVIDNGTK